MRIVTILALAAWACQACAVQAHAELEDLAVTTSNDSAPKRKVIINLNQEAAP